MVAAVSSPFDKKCKTAGIREVPRRLDEPIAPELHDLWLDGSSDRISGTIDGWCFYSLDRVKRSFFSLSLALRESGSRLSRKGDVVSESALYGKIAIPPTIAPACHSPPRTLNGIGGTSQGAQLPGR